MQGPRSVTATTCTSRVLSVRFSLSFPTIVLLASLSSAPSQPHSHSRSCCLSPRCLLTLYNYQYDLRHSYTCCCAACSRRNVQVRTQCLHSAFGLLSVIRNQPSVLMTARYDPIISPGGLSGHVHGRLATISCRIVRLITFISQVYLVRAGSLVLA